MNNENNFYLILAKSLVVLNFVSVFFTFVIVFFYAFLQYVGLEVLRTAEYFFGTSGTWYEAIVSLFELLLEIPGGLDTLFMAIIFLCVFNLFYFAYKSQQSGWLGFFFFLGVGLPIWLFISSKVVDIRDALLTYLNSTLIIKPDTTFFDYFTQYSLEFSAFVFITCVIIHMTDWENIRERIEDLVQSNNDTNNTQDSLEERFRQ